MVTALMLGLAGDGRAAEPSFSCRRTASTAERLICSDDALAALDRKMAQVYGAATKVPSQYADLNAGQRAWTRARNDCWQASDFRACIEELYVRRIAELQARYGLVASKGPFRYDCGSDAAGEVKATFFATEPPSAILDYDGQSVLALHRRSGGVARYEAGHASFREGNGESMLTWGQGAKEMPCTVKK